MTINFVRVEDYDALSQAGADYVADVIRSNPRAAVVVATGDTPMGMYRRLAEMVRLGSLDATRVCAFQLDAYVGLPLDDPRSLFGWTLRSFVRPLCIQDANVVRLRGDGLDLDAACREYDEAVARVGGFDLAILGLGPNGHLGFNEPPCGPDAPTRMVELTPESIVSNARYWGGPERVPRRALTAGMTVLLAARAILLVASGERKQDILRRTLEDAPCPDVPASYLQNAPQATVIADRAAVAGPRSCDVASRR
jgi:glucosamine-6-phosphate deaminase